MAEVILGRAGRAVVDSPLCAKTGRPTTQRVILRGSAMPTWVNFLFVFSFVGMLLAGAATSRRYVVDLPFSREAHDKWRRTKRAAWAIGLVGGATIVLATSRGGSSLVLLVGVALAVVGVVVGVVNSSEGNVGVGLTRDNDLILTRVHPAFVASLRAGETQPGR